MYMFVCERSIHSLVPQKCLIYLCINYELMVSLVNINCRFTFLFYVPHIWIFKILFSVTALQLKKN